jgi:hypothetical protein
MDTNKERWHWWRIRAGIVWLFFLLLGGPRLAAAQAPTAPAVSAGNYTVSYTSCGSCIRDWLEERREGGSWVYVSTGTLNVTNKPAGTYYYRAAYFYMVDPNYFYTATSYSTETRVTVSANVPTVDSLDTQLSYRYETRYGDGNGDGRLDLLLNRTAGGTSGNGALETVLLLQGASAKFSAAVPSTAQVAAARSWPAAAVQVVLRDFNVDGFADVLLKGVAGALGIGGALNQIVYAPGRVLTSLPLGVRPVDSSLKSFAANTRDYLVDSGYFRRNAPLVPILVPVIYQSCGGGNSLDYSGLACHWFVYYVTVVLPDYSVFEPNALAAWTQEAAIQENRTSRAQGVENIRRSFESAIGAPIGGRNLDGIAAEQGSLDAPARRGFELFLAVFGIFEANAQELNPPRDLNRNPNVVYVTGRRILGFLPFHTAIEFAGQTISAYDNNSSFLDDGTLVSMVNWPSDNPALMLPLGTVSSTLGAPIYWARLLAADARYRDNLDYDAVPSVGSAGYNSNGYVHGIVRATAGVSSIDLNQFVGGEKPVPPQSFN